MDKNVKQCKSDLMACRCLIVAYLGCMNNYFQMLNGNSYADNLI